MRCSQRLMTSAVLIALCGVLTGCGGGGLNNWDPSDMLGFLDTKKKLPGNRQPVFPEGVPGIEQGVPKDLYKSDVEPPQQAQEPAAAAAAPGPDGSGRGRRQGTADASGGAEAAAADAGTAAAAPRKPKRLVHRRATSLPKEESPSRRQATPPPPPPAAQQPEPAASPFPAPMPSGSFSR